MKNDFDPRSVKEIKQLMLKKLTFFHDLHICEDSLIVDYNNIFREIDAELRYQLFGQEKTVSYDVYFEVPTTWWDHFKRDVIKGRMKWLFSKPNTRMEKETLYINHRAIFPELNELKEKHNIVFWSDPNYLTSED